MASGRLTVLTALVTIVLFARASSTERLQKEIDVFNGSVHAWWIIFNVPLAAANAALPEKSPAMNVSVPASEGFPAGRAAVLVEAGTVTNYGFTSTNETRTSFDYMRISIPWVKVQSNESLFRYKSLMYTDKLEELGSSYLYYGIATKLGNFTVGDNNITVTVQNMTFSAVFTNETGQSPKPPTSMKNFATYEHIMNLTWFGEGIVNRHCARTNYDFAKSMVQAVEVNMKIADGILPGFKFSGAVHASGIDGPLGVAEIWANFNTTLSTRCGFF